MPTRVLREGINDSKAVNAVSEEAELLYRRLYSIVDDYGRFECDPDLIRARAFPRQMERWDTPRINRVMRLLTVDHGFSPLITVYKNGEYILFEINKFRQRCQHKPKFPGPADEGSIVDPRWITVDHGGSPLSRVESKTNVDISEKVEVVVKTEGGTPPTPSSAEAGFGDHDLFETLYAAHPQSARRERGIAEKYFVQSIAAGCDPAEIIRVHGLMCATEDWQWKHGAKAPTLGQWLLDKGWKYPPNGHANGNGHKPIEVCPSCQKKPCECGERFRKHAMQSGEQMIAAKRERTNGKV